GLDRTSIKAMTDKLRSKGWKIEGPDDGDERTEAAGKNEIRYRDDVRIAALLLEQVQAEKLVARPLELNKTSTTPAKTLELWVSKPARETASSTPLPPTPFDTQASALTRRLMDDFGFKDFQAAAIVGNIGYETG